MRTKILLFLLLYNFSSNAQLNYIEYHKGVAFAESLILDEKYSEAFFMYDSLFSIYPKRFSKDLYNATFCAIYAKQYDKAEKHFLELADLGISKYYFKNKIFKIIYKEKSRLKLSREYQKRYKQAYQLRRVDSDVKYIDSLIKEDQKFLFSRKAYIKYRDTINIIDSLNEIAVLNYIKEKGFPTEKQFLIKKPGRTINFYVLIRHAYQNKSCKFSEILEQQVKIGNLHPYIFAELEDKKSSNLKQDIQYGVLVYFNIQGKLIDFQKDIHRLDALNCNRQSIGLESLEEYKIKLNIKRNLSNPFFFMNYEGIVNLDGVKLKDFKKYTE